MKQDSAGKAEEDEIGDAIAIDLLAVVLDLPGCNVIVNLSVLVDTAIHGHNVVKCSLVLRQAHVQSL